MVRGPIPSSTSATLPRRRATNRSSLLALIFACDARPLPDRAQRVEIKMSMTARGCGIGDVLRNARTKSIGRRIQPCRPEQHGAASARHSRQKFSARKIGIVIFQHSLM